MGIRVSRGGCTGRRVKRRLSGTTRRLPTRVLNRGGDLSRIESSLGLVVRVPRAKVDIS